MYTGVFNLIPLLCLKQYSWGRVRVLSQGFAEGTFIHVTISKCVKLRFALYAATLDLGKVDSFSAEMLKSDFQMFKRYF